MFFLCWPPWPCELGASAAPHLSLYCQQGDPHNPNASNEISDSVLISLRIESRLPRVEVQFPPVCSVCVSQPPSLTPTDISIVPCGRQPEAPTGPLCLSLLPPSLSNSPHLSRQCSSVHSVTHQRGLLMSSPRTFWFFAPCILPDLSPGLC